jgi:PIN domain nuclease of toxin-antitoxin system
MKYLLDTHAWIWWHMNPRNLSEQAIDAIAHAESYDEILLSAISPWEFCKLVEKQRLGISCDPGEWLDKALDMPKLRLVPLSPVIAHNSTILPQPFHNDPADQIIVATARLEQATVITKDEKIRSYRHVQSLW